MKEAATSAVSLWVRAGGPGRGRPTQSRAGTGIGMEPVWSWLAIGAVQVLSEVLEYRRAKVRTVTQLGLGDNSARRSVRFSPDRRWFAVSPRVNGHARGTSQDRCRGFHLPPPGA